MGGVQNLQEKLDKFEKIYATMLCEWNNTRLPAVYKNCGLDFILIDLEHGAFFPENIGDLAQMCIKSDIPLIARIQDCEYHCISKCIDMGADGVLIPRTESMEQIETAIRSLRMPPYGKKGVGGRACLRSGESIAEFNKNRLLFLQIESPLGVELLDEMLTKYGEHIAGVIVGPDDMTIASGLELTDPKPQSYYDNIKKVFSISRAHGKSAGIFMCNDNAVHLWHEAGANIYWVGTEMSMMSAEARRIKNMIADL